MIPQQPIVIRRAKREDVSVISSVIRRSFADVARRFALTPENCPKHPSNCTDGWITADLNRRVRYFLLEIKGKPAGCVGLEIVTDGLCYMERLSVLPEYRNQGFGKALVQHFFTEAFSAGACRVSIGIIADHIELKNWYAEIGFREGETKEFPHLPFRVTFMTSGIL